MNKCAKVAAQGVLYREKPWKFAGQKATTFSFLRLGVEGRPVFTKKPS